MNSQSTELNNSLTGNNNSNNNVNGNNINNNGNHHNITINTNLSNGLNPNNLEILLNQPVKKKRTSKGAKFRMFTRVWVPAFNVAGCITQEKNGGWKYVQFDTGLPLPLPSALASTIPHSPRLLTKGLLDGKWCRACDMEEIHDGNGSGNSNNGSNNNNGSSNNNGNNNQLSSGLTNIKRDINSQISFTTNLNRHDLLDDCDSDGEFDGSLFGITDPYCSNSNSMTGSNLQYFSQHSNHLELITDHDYDNVPSRHSTSITHDICLQDHDSNSILTDDLDQLDSFLTKRRRDRSDSLDLVSNTFLNSNLSASERDVFLTLGMNTKLEDSMIGKLVTTGGMLDDVSWHNNVEYGGITFDDCDWNL